MVNTPVFRCTGSLWTRDPRLVRREFSGAQFNWKKNHHEKTSHQKVTKKTNWDFCDDFHDDFLR